MSENRNFGTVALEIAVVSFVILFQELALIRWIPSQVRVVAYFPNLILMSAFLGLGLGCLRVRDRIPWWLWPASMVFLSLIVVGMSRFVFTHDFESEHLWLLYFDLRNAKIVHDIRLPILIAFVSSVLTFVPLGHYLATRIAEMTRRGATLKGYALDLAGSLSGVVAFAVCSFLWMPPVGWFALIAVAGLRLFGRESVRAFAVAALTGLTLVAISWLSTRGETFSPYYAISTMPFDGFSGPVVLTNGSLHQYPFPVASQRNHPGLTDRDETLQTGYSFPYTLLKRPPARVLVLGAGTGNDVATALLNGAQSVDAVEIDPYIAELGTRLHPSRPYSDPRVTVFLDDARSFLQKTDRRYDLVVFGTLDSMTRLSALSSVRLDNFVYTRESLEAASRVLTPEGGLVMYFAVGPKYLGERLVALHHDVFGTIPASEQRHYVMFNLILMSGPAYDHVPRTLLSSRIVGWNPEIDRATDDWPFLYLNGRRLTPFYLQMIAALAVLAVVSILASAPRMRKTLLSGRIDLEMLGLGAAFLLLETRSVTQMNLVWGATWLTSSIVFGSILVMLLGATLLMDRRPVSARASVAGLVVTLLVSYVLPASLLLASEWPAKLFLSVLVIGSPIFFASTLFAVRFNARVNTDLALGWNLLGAVLGGLLEFSSMMIGIRNLLLLALALYIGATIAGAAPECTRKREETAPR